MVYYTQRQKQVFDRYSKTQENNNHTGSLFRTKSKKLLYDFVNIFDKEHSVIEDTEK